MGNTCSIIERKGLTKTESGLKGKVLWKKVRRHFGLMAHCLDWQEYSVICWFYEINCSIALLWLLQFYTGSIYKAALEKSGVCLIMAHINVSNHFKRKML